jgi:sugar phosphate isomerase/epimerase
MPYLFPDSADSYLKLIKAIDRKGFAVHMDPVNITTSPRLYLQNGEMIKDFFKKLGPHIRSCHGKDVIWEENQFLPHLSECPPGTGNLNYSVYLKEIRKLKDIPLMLEHLKTDEEYQIAANYVRSVGKKEGIEI